MANTVISNETYGEQCNESANMSCKTDGLFPSDNWIWGCNLLVLEFFGFDVAAAFCSAVTHNYLSGIISPITVFCGIPACLLTVFCMANDVTSCKSRIFYVSIALYFLPTLIFKHLLYYFSYHALSWYSEQGTFLHFDGLSAFTCRLSQFASGFGENASAFLTALYAFERLMVVASPFKAAWFTFTRSSLLTLLVSLQAVALNISAFYTFDYPEITNLCLPKTAFTKLSLTIDFVNFGVPNCLLLGLVVATYICLKKQQRSTLAHLNQRERGSIAIRHGPARKNTAILIAVASVRCAVYLPISILCFCLYFVSSSPSKISMLICAKCFEILTGLVCIADFVVYMRNIAAFRRKVLDAMRFRWCSSLLSPKRIFCTSEIYQCVKIQLFGE